MTVRCATIARMRLDHVCYVAEADGVHETAARLGAAIGVEPVDVGVHPRFGTRNVILPLAGGHYVEVLGDWSIRRSRGSPSAARCGSG